MSSYRKTMRQAREEMLAIKEEVELDESVIDKVKEIASKKSAKKIDGVMVDSFTASAISQIYDKVNDKNKKRMEKLPITKLADLAFKMMQKSEFVPEEVELDEAFKKGDKVTVKVAKSSDREIQQLSKKFGDTVSGVVMGQSGKILMVKTDKGQINPPVKDVMKEEVELDEQEQKVDPVAKAQATLSKAKKVSSLQKQITQISNVKKEDLDKEDEPKVKGIIKKLKGASQAHAGQAKDLEKAVNEAPALYKLFKKKPKEKSIAGEPYRYATDVSEPKSSTVDKTDDARAARKTAQSGMPKRKTAQSGMSKTDALKKGIRGGTASSRAQVAKGLAKMRADKAKGVFNKSKDIGRDPTGAEPSKPKSKDIGRDPTGAPKKKTNTQSDASKKASKTGADLSAPPIEAPKKKASKKRKSEPADIKVDKKKTSSFGAAFKAARKAHGGPGGVFTWKGKKYQTNVKGEKYVKNPKPVKVVDEGILDTIKTGIEKFRSGSETKRKERNAKAFSKMKPNRPTKPSGPKKLSTGQAFKKIFPNVKKLVTKGIKEEDFKPHMMYDPKTGKAYKAEKEEDHLRMKKMGYVHEKPKVKESDEINEVLPAIPAVVGMVARAAAPVIARGATAALRGVGGLAKGAAGVAAAGAAADKVKKILGDDEDEEDKEKKLPTTASIIQKRQNNEAYQLDEKIAGLVKKADKSGMPYGILKKVYDRGMAAWKTGHRPGTTPQQWAFARVNSFITKGSGTWGKADKDLASQVREALEIGDEIDESLWANIAAKRKRIKAGSGEKMRKKGEKGAPTSDQMAKAKNEGAASDARRAMAADPSTKQKFSKNISATDDDVKSADKNIMMQMRKAVSLRGNKVEFMDKKKVMIPQKIAQAVIAKYNSMKKPADKEKFQSKISKSYKSMLATLKEQNEINNTNNSLHELKSLVREMKGKNNG